MLWNPGHHAAFSSLPHPVTAATLPYREGLGMAVARAGVMTLHLLLGSSHPHPGPVAPQQPLLHPTQYSGAQHWCCDGLGCDVLEWQPLGRGYAWLNFPTLAKAGLISVVAGRKQNPAVVRSRHVIPGMWAELLVVVKVCTCPMNIQVGLGGYCLPACVLRWSLLVSSRYSQGISQISHKISLHFSHS